MVMSIFIIGGLFLLNGKKVEAKYQYSIKKQTITDSGVFQIQQKEDERIVLQFKPKKSGRYFIKIEAKGTGIDSAGIGFGQNGVFASSTTGTEGESVIHRESMYFEQGKICPITMGMGKCIGGAGDAIKSVACSYRLEIKKLVLGYKNYLQKRHAPCRRRIMGFMWMEIIKNPLNLF